MPDEQRFETLHRFLQRRPRDIDAAFDLARMAQAEAREEDALPLVEQAATLTGDAALWQWTGVLNQACDRSALAAAAYRRGLSIAPGDAKALHGFARATLEAGRPAVDAFEAARRAAPLDAPVLAGLALARQAQGATDAAIAGLDEVLLAHPGWYDGQELAAQLRWLRGDGAAYTAAIERALLHAPGDAILWRLLIDVTLRGEHYDPARTAVERARRVLGPRPFLDLADAAIASECGDETRATALFAELAAIDDEAVVVRYIRHALRSGRPEQARTIGEVALTKAYARSVLPYLGLAWRLLGDARADRLDHPRLVVTTDLAGHGVDCAALAVLLRRLHRSHGQQFDQSVRGGTQTAGHLFKRAEPEIVALRAAVVRAVDNYVERMPPAEPTHPVLGQRRDRTVRFSGAWSVRLARGGYHAAHVHPAGWLSSAIYVALTPKSPTADAEAGWLAIGAPPPELGLDLAPIRMIEPAVDRLVLFPSVAWHGTRPFTGGERMTAAFDVALPGAPPRSRR